jgi:hypothetical protein
MIILIDHDIHFFGASKYLFYLSHELKKKKITCQYIGIIPHDFAKFDFYYHNDLFSILKYIENNNPKYIYINSMNTTLFQIIDYIPKEKLIFHSHESMNDYPHESILPDFVVSEKIAQQYYDRYQIKPKIQRPFIPKEYIMNILQLAQEPVDQKYIDNERITIGMCGEISKRKNFHLFATIASVFPQYDFLWIGGHTEETLSKNIIVLPYTNNPYQYYYHCIDYFLLTSEYDPCPYVILENILLETPIILFEKSIFTSHTDELIHSFLCTIKDSFHLRSGIRSIYQYVVQKKTKKIIGHGQEYIQKYFSFPESLFLHLQIAQ